MIYFILTYAFFTFFIENFQIDIIQYNQYLIK